jgi:hypothetical protein
LLVQAFFLLLGAKLALLVVPVDRVLGWKRHAATPAVSLDADERMTQLRLVRWAVQAATKRSPIEFVCFPQSLAARALLHARGIETELYYGVMRKEGRLATHTWLLSEGFNVIGGEGAEAFSVLAVY